MYKILLNFCVNFCKQIEEIQECVLYLLRIKGVFYNIVTMVDKLKIIHLFKKIKNRVIISLQLT